MNRAYERALAAYTPDQQVQKELAGMPKYDREQAIQANVRMLRKLRESQKLWLAYRDSACATVEEKYEGGTITALVVPLCRKDLAGQRKRFLQDNFGN
jgi:uncharacterized protein YecT (DUF1311 family)